MRHYKSAILLLMLFFIPLISGCITEGVLKAKFSNLPQWTEGVAGTYPLTVEGGTPPYACAITKGALPPGFALANCEIDGTPPLLAGGTTQSVSPPFTVTITDSNNPPNTLAVEMAIVVKRPSLTLITNPVACAVGQYCSANLIANITGGTPPYHYQSDTFRNGTPPWGTVVGIDGLLIGIPTRAGTYTFGVCAVDSVALSKCEQVTAKIEPEETGLIILITNTATCAVDKACDADLVFDVSGGTPPYLFETREGTLPPGTTLSTDGFLEGTPTDEGTYTFEVCAVDSTDEFACEQTTVTIEAAAELLILITNDATCIVDEYCDADLVFDVSGGISPYEFEVGEGTAPFGTTLGIDGFLTGVPTLEGTYTFEVCAVDVLDKFTCEEATVTIELPEETTYSGPFSISGNYGRPFPDYGTTCTFADDFIGTISLNLIEEVDGTVSGTANVEGTFTSTAIAGSTYSFTCLSSQTPWSDSSPVSGTTSSLQFDTVFITAGGSTYTGAFSGSLGADSVTGNMEFTSPCCTGSASNSVTLAKE